MWAFRRMLRIPWTDMMTNEEVLNKADAKRLMIKTLRERKLRYFVHLIRLNHIQSITIEGFVEGKRQSGRPRTSWYDNIREWTGLINYPAAVERAQDRQGWKATMPSNATAHGRRSIYPISNPPSTIKHC